MSDTRRTNTLTLAAAMDALARDIQSEDGVANAAIAEAAQRLHDLERENAALRADKDRLDWLQRFLQLGGASIFTICTGQAQEPRTDDTDETRWNHPFCIGHDVEVEHRGCYRWEELGNGSRAIRAAIDAARKGRP